MKISDVGIGLIKRFEGRRLDAYQDAVGVWTIGYGHTGDVRPGMRTSESGAEDLLRGDLRRFEAAVGEAVQVPINQHQFDALVSFAFNVGADALRRSTLLRLLNEGKTDLAALEFPRWVRAGGRVLAGLQRRREAEQALFLTPMPTADEGPRPYDPDGIVIDLPTLRGPFPASLATAVLRVLLQGAPVGEAKDMGTTKLERSVCQFQTEQGLTPDGIVGPVTWRALLGGDSRHG